MKRILHFSDLHFGVAPWQSGWRFDKHWIGTFNHFLRRRRLWDAKVLDEIEQLVEKENPDLVICTGDLSAIGDTRELLAAEERLLVIREKAQGHFLYVPGNHDKYTTNNRNLQTLHSVFRTLNSGLELADLPVRLLCQGFEIFLVDQGKPTGLIYSYGFQSDESWQKLRKMCSEHLPVEGIPRILIGHYPTLLANGKPDGWRHGLRDWNETRQFLQDNHFNAYLCGHIHQGFIHSADDGKAPAVPVFCAGSATLFHNFITVDFLENGNINGHLNCLKP